AGALEALTVAVDENRLQACAMALWGEEFDSRRHRQRLMLNDVAARRRMAARLGLLLEDARRDGARLANRAIAKGFEAAVLEAIFESVSGREWIGSAPARYRQAQVAADFLHAHCREEVSVADLCVTTGASRRTLHLGFYEVFGISPIQYLTSLRLNGVGSELRKSRGDAGDAAGAVTRAAMSWGFTHLGHFSARYKAQFGESPSETLRR
ncbi:MAG: helix-turn-helix transcriptional regulator, partial [Methylococcales bacterium]|nr:helix-turn-helix transcriptional regulator [Methylococcales bacterium]